MTLRRQAIKAPITCADNVGHELSQVIDRIVAKGCGDVREIERKSDKLYEVEARDAQGRRVELSADARSGEVMREEAKR